MKKFNFSLTDNTTYCGKNALDFYSRALLQGGSKELFRVIPGVKSKIKLPIYDSGAIIKDAGCAWSPSGEGTLNQKAMEVCSKDIQLEFCATTFENNFLGEMLKPGHNVEHAPTQFIDYVLDNVANKIQHDLEIAVWQGVATDLNYPYNICDGLLKKAVEANDFVEVFGTAVTTANVVAEITKVYDKIPVTVLNDPNLTIFVADNIYRAYLQAVANASSEAYYVGAKEANFLGIKLVLAPGMPTNNMVASSTENIVLLTDLLSDEEELNIIPQAQITGVRTVRVSGGFKFGVDYVIGDEFVWYRGSAGSGS